MYRSSASFCGNPIFTSTPCLLDDSTGGLESSSSLSETSIGSRGTKYFPSVRSASFFQIFTSAESETTEQRIPSFATVIMSIFDQVLSKISPVSIVVKGLVTSIVFNDPTTKIISRLECSPTALSIDFDAAMPFTIEHWPPVLKPLTSMSFNAFSSRASEPPSGTKNFVKTSRLGSSYQQYSHAYFAR